MLSRQCIKITSSTRALFFNKFPLSPKFVIRQCLCKHSKPSRTLVTSASIQNVETTWGKSNRNYQSEKSKNLKKTESFKHSALSSEELLEKLIAGLSTDIHQKNRVYKNDLVRVLAKISEIDFSTKKQSLLLLSCCTELLPDEAPSTRMSLAEQVWNTIKPHTTFDVDHYNELLKVYIANNRTLVTRTFLKQMEPVKPNNITYELILKTIGEAGDVNQATEVIANMKAQNIPATEKIFNSLIICQGKAGNLQNIQEILTMMTSLKLARSANTYTAVARALAWNKQEDKLLEEMGRAHNSGLQFSETQVMDIVKTLAAVNMYTSIPQVLKFLPEEILKTPSITPYMQSVSTLLVFQNHPMAALEIYKCLPLPSFGPKDDQGLHGRSLVRDCVKAAMPSSIIGLITQDLMASGRNPIALQNATEAALQFARVPLALDLFTRMKQLGMPLRCHFFWPILMHSSKTSGEKGIMNTLSTMVNMEVQPDYETLMNYTLPFVSFTSPQNLMKKFLETGLTVSVVLTPMMETLLNTGQVRAASEICELFKGKIDAEKILKPLMKGYLISMDMRSTVHILEDITKNAIEKNRDWVGRFLCLLLQHKKAKDDLSDFINIAKALKEIPVNISTSAADNCLSRLPDSMSQERIETFRNVLVDITDERLVDEGDIFVQQIPHPKNMNEESLKAHLIELEAKGMNTRGVLRKLLQEYCRSGDLNAAKDIVDKCQKEGVYLSAGMKAAIFDLHVKLGELDLAEMALSDLNKTSPNFVLDEYKVIDFATLMVYRKKIGKAFELISEQSKRRNVMGGRNISMNCWRLLDAVAAHGSHLETRQMFELLTSLRYCEPSNSILGPLIRAHLKNNNFQEAVNEFTRIANQYNKTPLKHELLCKILHTMNDGRSEENFLVNEKSNGMLNRLAQTVLNVDRKVHGSGDVQLTLIAALAEVGYKKTLRKMFLDPTFKFHPDALMRRCERFADERKVAALETVAECAHDLRHVDVAEIYEMILDVHKRDDNYESALALWTKMQEADITPSQKFIRSLCSLAKVNNKPIPPELSSLLDKTTTKAVNP